MIQGLLPTFRTEGFLFRKIGGTPFAKSKIQRMSANFVHFKSIISAPILLRRKFWGISLHCNGCCLVDGDPWDAMCCSEGRHHSGYAADILPRRTLQDIPNGKTTQGQMKNYNFFT